MDLAVQKAPHAPVACSHLPAVITFSVRVMVVPVTVEHVRVIVLFLESNWTSSRLRMPLTPEAGVNVERFEVSVHEFV
jgi:hypothetical protein